jgi:hypothetical protein
LRRKSVGIILISLMIVLGFAGLARAALIDNGDGTITDDDTGLMWLQVSNDTPMNWWDAMDWADELVFAGYDDWRLPNAINVNTRLPDTAWQSIENEWGHLYGFEWDDPYVPADILPMTGYTCSMYWTETEVPGTFSEAYAFFTSYNGVWRNDEYSKRDLFCATAVRVDSGTHPPITLRSPPVACFTETAHGLLRAGPISFDPSCSFDSDGSIVLYEWDFDGDGVYDYSSTTPEVVTHDFENEGSVTVTLRVTDNDGLTDTTTAIKTVWPVFVGLIPILIIVVIVLFLILLIPIVYAIRRTRPPAGRERPGTEIEPRVSERERDL